MLRGMDGNTSPTTQTLFSRLVFSLFRFIPFWVLALAVTRLLYETFFPALAWVGRPFPALLLSTLCALPLSLLAPRLSALPLLLNLLYLLDPDVNLTRGYLVLAMAVWGSWQLSAVSGQLSAISVQPSAISYQLTANSYRLSAISYRWWVVVLLVGMVPVYGLTMPATVGRADTFEFQVVATNLGIAHPTGYPLYLLLGKLWTWLIPFGSLAWRLNVGTAVFALVALSLLYLTSLHLHKTPLPALLGAVAVGLTPTFWSQAIEAEVYTLHALVVAGVVGLMVGRAQTGNDWKPQMGVAVLIGLGLTNHLTTVFLIPPALLFLLFTLQPARRQSFLAHFPKLLLAFFVPLLLYLYLPLRWQAVNGEAMGFGRFVDWVVGGRFQGALQLTAWLHDPTRYEIIGRLFLDNWGWFNLGLILVGFCYLLITQWRVALLLFTTWFGFTFYALNYYVPDVAVFLIPAHWLMGLCWASGAYGIGRWQLEISKWRLRPQSLLPTLLLLPLLTMLLTHWPALDRSDNDGLTTWGMGVLQLPLAPGAAILADSEKIAPLYYLQQAEGIRPDLDILVLPDETAYRTELDGRLAAGQTVYLARFLPGLEGIYHLRSLGPLTEVSLHPLTTLPADVAAAASGRTWNGIELAGYTVEPQATIDPLATAVTFYWRTAQPIQQTWHIYTRWQGQPATSQHPANNYYPTVAWEVGEVVADFHLLPHPVAPMTQTWQLQAAFAPPFTPPDALVWQTVTSVELPPTPMQVLERPFRAQLGSVWLTGSQFPSHIRPQTPLPLLLAGYGGTGELVRFQLSAISGQPLAVTSELSASLLAPRSSLLAPPFIMPLTMPGAENGRYQLTVTVPGELAYCGWLARANDGCVLGEVEISGVPLPPTAHNFEDKIALLQTDLPVTQLQPGGLLDVTLSWLSLAPVNENYTVFVQVVDANDRLVGQVDAWPRQGTHPTSQWQPGEVVVDPYTVQLDPDLTPGNYRLLVGWYLLGTLQRLQVVDGAGTAVNDKVEIPGLLYEP